MNSLEGNIQLIEQNGNLSLVTINMSPEILLKTIIVETPQSVNYLKVGHKIKVLFKETEVVIGTSIDHSISLQNRICGTISEIEKGTLLSRVVIKTSVGQIESIISTKAAETLQLKTENSVVAMIKLNEIMLSE